MPIHLQYAECPGCKCGRSELIEQDPNGEQYPATALIGKTLGDLEDLIHSVRNATELLSTLDIIKEKHGVPILIWTDYTIQIRKTSGLCKRTRKRLQEAFETIDRDILKDTIAIATEDME